jgi:hypothetical protein
MWNTEKTIWCLTFLYNPLESYDVSFSTQIIEQKTSGGVNEKINLSGISRPWMLISIQRLTLKEIHKDGRD